MDDCSDDDLMARAQAGDTRAFGELVRRHQRLALCVACRYLGDESTGKDAVQRAFAELYRYLPKYDARGRLRALLMRIVVNQCRMMQRKAGRIRAVTQAVEQTVDESVPGPDALMSDGQRRMRLSRAIARLSEKLRDVVSLRYVAEMPYAEIAETLGIKVGTVKSRLSAGIEALRKELEADI